MTTHHRTRIRWLLPTILITLSIASARPAIAQGLPGHIAYIFPAGGQRGTTSEILVTGANLSGATEARISGKGVTAKVVKIDEGKKARISVTLDDDTKPGIRDLRLVTPNGYTNRFRFVVGEVSEIREEEPNSKRSEAQPLPTLPVTINGQAYGADKDTFRFSAKAGETIVCRVSARELMPFLADAVPGWFQAVLTLYDAKGDKVAYVDDYRFDPDPVLIYKVERDGDYLIEIRDSIYRGRGDFVYRICLGKLPFVTDIYPLGAARDSTCRVQLRGANLPKNQLEVDFNGNTSSRHYVDLRAGGLTSNRLPLAIGRTTEIEETEPNHPLKKGERIKTPVTINGRIQQPGDVDSFVFQAEAGKRLVMEVEARRLGSPLDSILCLYDANGKKVAENDDTEDATESLMTHHADSRLIHTFKTSGEYTLRLRDLQGKGGTSYAYRLVVASPRPDFALLVTPDNPRVGQGDTVVLTVRAIRHDGFVGAIDLTIKDLPEGFTTSGTEISSGENETILTLTAPSGAPLGLHQPTIVGTAKIGERTVTHQAQPAEDDMQAFIYHHYVPTEEFLLSVLEPPPFKLIPQLPSQGYLTLGAGRTAFLDVKVVRTKGTRGPVKLMLHDPPKGTRMRTAVIQQNADSVKCTFNVSNQTPKGFKQNLIIIGTMKVGKETLTTITPIVPLLGPSAKKPKKKP